MEVEGGVLGVYRCPIVPRPLNTSDSHSCERPTAVPECPNRPESGSGERHFSDKNATGVTFDRLPQVTTGFHRFPQVTTGFHRLPYGYLSSNTRGGLPSRLWEQSGKGRNVVRVALEVERRDTNLTNRHGFSFLQNQGKSSCLQGFLKLRTLKQQLADPRDDGDD
jgi:hypothetical protein